MQCEESWRWIKKRKNMNLISVKIKSKLEIEKIGDYYSIDSSGVIKYKNGNGKILKKNLN